MRKALLTALLGGTSIVAFAATASAQSLVNRHDDGAIEVTSDVGDSVVFPKGTLGSLIEDAWANGEPSEKPFAGDTISIVTLNAGPRGAISGGILPWEAAFEQLTGADVEVVLRPFNDLAPVIFNDLFTGTGAYDAFVPPMVFLGDMKDYLLPLNDYMCDPRFPKVWTDSECAVFAENPAEAGMETLLPAIQPLFRWGDQWYAVPWDIDSHVLFYRKDILENPEVQAKYKEDTGRDLGVPKSLQELQEIACYFQGKDPLGNGITLTGVVQPGGPNSQLFDWWKDIAGSWTANPDGTQQGVRKAFHFDPETMEPLINSPGHVAALQWMIDTYKCGPSDFASIDLGGHFNRFVQGTAVFAWSAGDIAALGQEEGSKVQGNIGLIPIPGSTSVENAETGEMMTVDTAIPNYNVYGASWSGEISSLSDNPDSSYAFIAFLGSQPMRNWNVKWGFDGIDIGRQTDFLPPDGTSDIEIWKAGGFNEDDARTVSHGIYENLTGPAVEYLKIPGSAEYNLALELAVQQALTGQVTAQEALDSVADQWREITERLGVDEQKAAYQETTGLGG